MKVYCIRLTQRKAPSPSLKVRLHHRRSPIIDLNFPLVRSYGTEDRVTDKPVAPRNEVYEYIIFRASDIKDLIVDDPPAAAPAPGLADPAIIQAVSFD